MHPQVYQAFEQTLESEEISGRVLEIGAIPNKSSLLTSDIFKNSEEKIGLNLNGGSHNDFNIVQGNANNMSMFEDNSFDCIVCNATLEHDKYFWKTLSEIRRIADEDTFICIGVPGYTSTKERPASLRDSAGFFIRKVILQFYNHFFVDENKNNIKKEVIRDNNTESPTAKKLKNYYDQTIGRLPSRATTATFPIHNEPGDYYRFSRQTIDEVFLKDTKNRSIIEIMQPPRLIGKGIYER